MPKAFLSHSSKQKGFVSIVAEKLGKSNIVYDAWTFEEGAKTIDEIQNGLEESDLFVFFISEDALESNWVKKEINKCEVLIKQNKMKGFLPFIIDQNITHNDVRIPDWIKREFNIRYVAKPTKAAERIKQILKSISWDLYPTNKKLNQLFIGRTELIKKYEERIYNFEKVNPLTIFVSGLPSIGRRKFITHCFKNSTKIRNYYNPPLIVLGSRDSVEDFITRVYDLGYSEKDRTYILDLSSKPLSDKIEIATTLLLEVEKNETLVYVLDNNSIVGPGGTIVDWMLPVVNNISRKIKNRIFLTIISRHRVKFQQIAKNDLVFDIEVPELEKYERKALFKSLLDVEKTELSVENFNTISELFNGYPEQVHFAYNVLMHEGLPYLVNNLHEIADYNTEKVSKVVQKYDNNDLAKQVLKLLSEFDFISINILEKILGREFEISKPILSDFSNEFIIEFVGNSREYIRLNDVIRDYVQRAGFKLDAEFETNIESHVKSAFADYDNLDRDISDYVISIKEALKRGFTIPKELLIPSHFVNAMRELYNYERKYNQVILLADRVLSDERNLDQRIVREIRYWLCLSLARKRDSRILTEVQKMDGAEHQFLLGFYYRLCGRFDDSIVRLKKALEIKPGFYRAKSELIIVYLNLEAYHEAFDLARETYFLDKNNPYNLQSYFRCLLTMQGYKAKDELESLLESLNNSVHEKASEMYYTSRAQFIAYIENNESEAIKVISRAMDMFHPNIYPSITKIEILKKYNNWEELKKTIARIESTFDADSDIFTKLPYLSAKCLLLSLAGDSNGAKKFFLTKVKGAFPESVLSKIITDISSITHQPF